MATQLNIKDPATIELARTLARRSGRSVTATIRDALERENTTREDESAARADQLLAELRNIPAQLPPELAGKSSRQIVQEFHEQEWQDQYGRDEWS